MNGPTRTAWVRQQYELLRSLTVRGQLDLAFLLALQAALAPRQAEVEAIAAKFTDQLTADLKPLETEAEELRQAIADRADEFCESFLDALLDRPQPEMTPPDESHWLFDASREYVQQLGYYKHISRNGHDEEREEHL